MMVVSRGCGSKRPGFASVAGLLALLAVGALAGCGGSASTSLANAAARTSRTAGLRFSLTILGQAAGQTFTIHGTGSLGRGGRRGEADLVSAGHSVHELLAAPDVYVQTPELQGGSRAPASPWVKLNLERLIQALGASGPLTVGYPSQVLLLLRATGSATRVGQAGLGALRTTHYRATADLTRYASLVSPGLRVDARRETALLARTPGSATLPVDVWVDSAGRVRRVRVSLSACSGIRETATLGYYGFGAQQPSVAVPPPAQVSDGTQDVATQVAAAIQGLGSC